jgi:antirestriction protein ArdC
VVLLWIAQAAGYRTPRYLTFKQALELSVNVRKGEHGTRLYFVPGVTRAKALGCSEPARSDGLHKCNRLIS